MSSSIDTRVVSMEFENSKFEKNVSTTQKTLNKLKEMLNFKDAGKGFDSIDKAASKVNFSSIEKALDTVSSRFSNLGIIGMTVLQNLTNRAVDAAFKIGNALTSAITSGGKNRALNLEAAQFQIEGLGYAWSDVEEDINYGVKSTAYGLDAAAKAASQLLASQVKTGSEMKTALRGISGVAAMTSSEYDDIAKIFTTVAGNGKLMGDQLMQLSSRGLNAAATLGSYLGKSEKEVREMVSKGKIDFQTFANAMDSAFGAHAKDANKTFTGALSNMKAALSRLGAAFYTPGFTYARDVINALTPVIDSAKEALGPFIDLVEKGMKVVSEWAVGVLNKIDFEKSIGGNIKNVVDNISNKFIPGLKNLKDIFFSVFYTIKDAFTAIFPSLSSFDDRVNRIGDLFLKFTEKIKPSESALDKLSRIFKGLFSAISLAKQILTVLVGVFVKFLVILAPVGKALVNAAAKLGDFLTRLDQAAKDGDVFARAIEKIKKVLRSFIDSLKSAYSRIREFFSNFSENASTILPKILNKFKEIFKKILDHTKEFISNLASKFTFEDVIIAITGALSGGVLVKIYQFFDELKNSFQEQDTDTIRDKVKSVLGNLSTTLEDFQNSIKADVIIKIAIAMGILAASCVALSKVDPGRLGSSLAAITVMFGELFAFMGGFSKVLDARTFMNINLVTGAMIKLSVAVLVLSFAVSKLGKLGWKELTKGLASVGFLCFTLGKTIQKARFDSLRPSTFVGLVGLAISIRILASAVEKLGSLDLKTLVKGLSSMLAILFVLTGFIFALSKMDTPKNMVSIGTGLVLLSASMLVFAVAVKKLGDLSIKQLAKGLGSFVVILGALTAALNFFPKSPMVLASATAILELAIAMNVLGFAIDKLPNLPIAKPNTFIAIGKLGNLSIEQLVKGLSAFAISIGILTGVLLALTNLTKGPLGAKVLVVATAIGVLAAAFTMLTPALLALGAMSYDSIFKSLLMLASVFVILGAAAYAFSPIIPAIFGLSAAIALLGVGVAALGIGVVSFAAGVISLAGSAAIFIQGMTILVEGMVRLIPRAAAALAEGLLSFAQTILNGAPKIIQGIVALIQQIIESLTETIPQFMKFVNVLVTSVLEVAMELLPQFTDFALLVIQELITVITESLPEIINLGMNLILGFLQGIASNIYQIAVTASQIIISFINGIASQIGAIIQAGFDLMISFLNGLADGIRTNMGLVMDAVWNVITAIIESVLDGLMGAIGGMLSAGEEFIQGAIDGISNGIDWAKNAIGDVVQGAIDAVGNFINDMMNAGGNLIQGLIDGIANMGGKVVDAIGNIANSAIDTVKSWFGIASPSKVFRQIGVYTMEGFIIGIDKMSSKVDNAMKEVGSNAIDSMRETLANVGKDISKDLSSDLTITPVLDLTQVNKGMDGIYSSFKNRTASISLETTTNKALSALKINKSTSGDNDNTQGHTVINNYDMTQNNYSPKALSRIEIYRDTKNQFSRLKGIGG